MVPAIINYDGDDDVFFFVTWIMDIANYHGLTNTHAHTQTVKEVCLLQRILSRIFSCSCEIIFRNVFFFSIFIHSIIYSVFFFTVFNGKENERVVFLCCEKKKHKTIKHAYRERERERETVFTLYNTNDCYE